MRYFVEAAYLGTNYVGWQIQPNGMSIQEVIEEKLSTFLRQKIRIAGCGRTDAGVHASSYFFHFDHEVQIDQDLIYRLNQMLPIDIWLKRIFLVRDTDHARHSATLRKYVYRIHRTKNPFNIGQSWHLPRLGQVDKKLLQSSAGLLLEFNRFFPFCKSNSDSTHYLCDLKEARWITTIDDCLEFHISANRFLRGMVRLIVGMCVNVSLKQVDLEEVRHALENQLALKKALSVPPDGLFLTEVHYPFSVLSQSATNDHQS